MKTGSSSLVVAAGKLEELLHGNDDGNGNDDGCGDDAACQPQDLLIAPKMRTACPSTVRIA